MSEVEILTARIAELERENAVLREERRLHFYLFKAVADRMANPACFACGSRSQGSHYAGCIAVDAGALYAKHGKTFNLGGK